MTGESRGCACVCMRACVHARMHVPVHMYEAGESPRNGVRGRGDPTRKRMGVD